MLETATLPAPPETNQGEAPELVRKVLTQADEPLSVGQILKELPKSVRPTEAIAESVVDAEVAANRVFKYPPIRGKEQYWTKPPSSYARQRLLRYVERAPRSQSEILREVGRLASLKDVSKTELKRIFESLQREGVVHKLPSYIGARTALFSTSQPNPADYLADALQKLSKKLGISIEQIMAGHPARNSEQADTLDERITEAMKELDAQVISGGMVSIADLRRQLDANLSGAEFDRALLADAAAGRVAVHRFDRAGLLSEQERSGMLRDDQGNYYNTVSLGR